MEERIAIIDGLRSPIGRAGGALKSVSADDLGAYVLREFIQRMGIEADLIDEVIVGCVGQPSNAANIGRVIALKAGLDKKIPAITVHRNCASGMEAITTGVAKILSGEAEIIIAGGAESMSNYPLIYGQKMTEFFARLNRAKTMGQRLTVMASFKPSFLKPRISLMEGLTDPTCGLIMGLTAENLAKEFFISREAQDDFALLSHQKAAKAVENGVFKDEIIPYPLPPKYESVMSEDESIRKDQTIEALAKLRPYFDREAGSVTVGNSCPINDGAGFTLIMKESKAKELGLKPLGYLREYAYAGLDAHRMGLGPVFATSKLLNRTGLQLKDFKLVEINEAFAAQVLGCAAAFDSKEFAKNDLGLDKAIGTLDMDILNVNGGAIAIGHPVGMTGLRLVVTLLNEMRRRKVNLGLASLCVGGGQGAALALEVE